MQHRAMKQNPAERNALLFGVIACVRLRSQCGTGVTATSSSLPAQQLGQFAH